MKANGFDANDIRIFERKFTVRELVELLETGWILLDSASANDAMWKDNGRKARLIESMMLDIPVPDFWFYENRQGKWHVVDGQQRLRAIQDFFLGKLSLTGLSFMEEGGGGKTVHDLPLKYVRRIRRMQCTVHEIDPVVPLEIVREFFCRVQMGVKDERMAYWATENGGGGIEY